jgi:small subunit ribosomal protein S16
MSVKIRLKRMGATKRPFYRIVVADSRSPRDGRFIETLGYYNPCVEPVILKIDPERAKYWLGVGAQPSDTASALFKKEGLIERSTKHSSPKLTAKTADES